MNTIQLTRHDTHYDLCMLASKVNVLNEALIQDLSSALEQIEQAPLPVLVRSAHRDFVLGADITAFKEWFAEPADQVNARISATQRVFDRFAQLPCATLAWIDGFALGGGFELALACDYRAGADGARVGLPEVTLGLCPSWGGTVRSAQLMGYQAACKFVLSGRPITLHPALQAGLIDYRADTVEQAVETLLGCDDPQRGLNLPKPASEEIEPIEDRQSQRAQAQIGQLMSAIQSMDLQQAQAAEVEVFVALAQSSESEALVQRYLNDQACKRSAKQIAAKTCEVKTIGVVGAGIMGGGIAWQCAVSGFDVVIRDLTDQALQAAQDEVARLAGAAQKKGRMDQAGAQTVLARLQFSTQLESLAEVDVIIEAVTEQERIKHAVLAEVDRGTSPAALITSNTSTLSISGLAAALQQPEGFAGLHFFNPVPVMPLVEVIRGQQTAPDTMAVLVALAGALGKRAVVVNDCPGFLVNRVLFPYLNAFDELAAKGCDIAQIDQVMKAYGWPMGPGVLSDVIGIDTCVHASDVMAQGFPKRMPVPHPSAMRERMNAGLLGQKTQEGFYRFEQDERGRLMPVQLSPAYSDGSQQLSAEEIVEVLMRPMVLELARCVDEGVVESAAVADTACLLGLGYPGWRCGPLYWGQQMGWVQGYY